MIAPFISIAMLASEVWSGSGSIIVLALSSILLLVILSFICRERWWRRRVDRVSKAAGLNGFNAEEVTTLLNEHRYAGQKLTKEEYLRRLFEALLNEIRQGVIIVDDHLRIKFCNRTMRELLNKATIHRGRTLLEELQDLKITETVESAIQNQCRCVTQMEFPAPQKGDNLTHHYYLAEAAPLPATAQRGAWLMLHDITEQTLTEQIRKDFVANASHELRTPLTLINGYIETLQSGIIEDEASLKRCLDVMEKHGQRIVRIIEDMLTISKLEVGHPTLSMAPFTMQACVQDALDHLASMIEGRDVQLRIQFPSDGGQIHGDRFYWDQVFTNLIENSLKENTGRSLVIEIIGEWFDDHAVIRIRDNGIGISAQDLPFVFKRFYRSAKHHSPQIKGTGLGLSIVKRAIEAHGGIIDLTSIPEQETTFTIRIPLRMESLPPTETRVTAKQPPASNFD